MTRNINRRDFLRMSSETAIAVAAGTALGNAARLIIDSAWYTHTTTLCGLPMAPEPIE